MGVCEVMPNYMVFGGVRDEILIPVAHVGEQNNDSFLKPP